MPMKIQKWDYKPGTIHRNTDFLRKRELGFKNEIGFKNKLTRKIIYALENNEIKENSELGGIFNLEFSLNGSLLAAACEKAAIILYDALNQKKISVINNAHESCVNCIRFLDSVQFATGSDDNTIKTWDLRYMKYATRTLRGHSNWVKNIEYSTKDNRLLTSAFDGGVFSWDLNNYTEEGVLFDRVYILEGLMRMKLTPDCSKMIMCTTQGYILVIHDINIETLSTELDSFKPSIYRLMQESKQYLPIAGCWNNLFSPYRKSNRVEIISDFPNNAEVISSLQIHPMGWCALTRNIDKDELNEWTCVHDIQERSVEDYLDSFTPINPRCHVPRSDEYESRQMPLDLWLGILTNENMRNHRLTTAAARHGLTTGFPATRTSIRLYNSGIINAQETNTTTTNSSSISSGNGSGTEQTTTSSSSSSSSLLPPPPPSSSSSSSSSSSLSTLSVASSSSSSSSSTSSTSNSSPIKPPPPPLPLAATLQQTTASVPPLISISRRADSAETCKIIDNLPRLTHYTGEPNSGKGYIKELCFSTDGRIICSPYKKGIRLLSFNPLCDELNACVPNHPQELTTVAHHKDFHKSIVLSCKFNPYHWQIVSGCLSGHIAWYNPKF